MLVFVGVINSAAMNEQSDVIQRLEETVKLLAVLARRSTTQSQLIHELSEVGFSPKRIAELLGTTPNMVSVTVHKKRKAARIGK